MRVLMLVVSSLFLAVPVSAQQSRFFDCSETTNRVSAVLCNDSELVALDESLAMRYVQAVGVANDTSDDAVLTLITNNQSEWLKTVDRCDTAKKVKDCLVSAYKTRTAELIARWKLDDAFNAVGWVCGTDPAFNITTAFYQTDPDTVRIENAGQTDVGFIVPTASGSRYDAPSGAWIWLKGDKAAYQSATGPEVTCTLSGNP